MESSLFLHMRFMITENFLVRKAIGSFTTKKGMTQS